MLSPLTLSRSPRQQLSPWVIRMKLSSVRGEVSLVTVLSCLEPALLDFAFVPSLQWWRNEIVTAVRVDV